MAFRSNKYKFWERPGALWLPFESKSIQRYAEVKVGSRVAISGCVSWIQDDVFALTPTQFSSQIYLICLNLTERNPNTNSYIMVEGIAKWERLKQLRRGSTSFEGVKVIHVDNWYRVKPDFMHTDLHEYFGLSSEYSLKDFKTNLLRPIEGLEPAIEDFLVFTFLGAPAFGLSWWQSGGINLALYDSTKSGLSKLVLKEIRRIIPSDMSEIGAIETPFGKFGLRYPSPLLEGDVDKPLSSKLTAYLTRRPLQPLEDNEVSLSLASKNRQPNSFEDMPCAFSDIPTVIPETTDIYRRSFSPDPDTFKYILIQHMQKPEISEYENSIISLRQRIEKLREDFDLDPFQLSQHGFLNANIQARPTQIFRQGLAYARAHKISKISSQEVQRAYDYFKWNLNYVYQIWEDLFKEKRNPSDSPDRAEYGEIRRIIRKYDAGNGVGEETIIQETRMQPQKAMQLIQEMSDTGWIYCSSHKKWRLTFG